MRSRPDDFSSTTNSMNPSPKKQPRLNLQCLKDNPWSLSHHHAITTNVHDNMYKRYKLEDNFSDIQYIDCLTPEHTASIPNTVCAQIHNPPTSSQSSDLNDNNQNCKNTTIRSIDDNIGGTIRSRFSYPGMKLEDSENNMNKEERLSYPGDGKKFICRVQINNNGADVSKEKCSNVSGFVTKSIGRYSYCDPFGGGSDHNPIKLVLRSNSAENMKRSDLEKSKLNIVTPSSPVKSPRYSLLVGDTSSENSSSMNTPMYDRELSASGATLQSTDQLSKDGINYASDSNNSCNVSMVFDCLIILI